MPRPVASEPPLADLYEGDWLDVKDHDGIWSVARVLSVPSPDEVEITYDGWPSDYDEVVALDGDRVAPYHTYTWAVKCWVKHLNWPMWPSVVTVRSPGTEAGMKNLNKENKLHMDFMDSSNFSRRARCWLLKGNVKPFDDKHDERRMGTNGNQFEQAYGFVLQSNSEDILPKFVPRGTLPVKFKDAPAESVETKRKEMGDEAWFAMFAKNQELHQKTHQYIILGGDGEDAASVESVDVAELTLAEQKPSKPKAAKAKRTKVLTAQTKAKTKAKPAVEEEKTVTESKRSKLSIAVKQDELVPSTEGGEEEGKEEEEEEEAPKPKRPKLSTAVGNGKTARKGKRTKQTTAVKRAKMLPISSNRRLLCVKK